MLHAAVLRSPHPRARVTKLDTSKARDAEGVHAILEPGDTAELVSETNFQGEPIAAIAADTLGEAYAALALVDVEFEVLEPMLEPEKAVAARQLTTDPREEKRGDVERGFAEADIVVEATYRTQTVLHNSMETHQAVCDWEGDTLVIYISTQFIWGVRNDVAERLELPADKVRVVCDYMGGGFGSKNGPDHYTYIAAELAKRTGRPVKCALTRREENIAAGNRNATIQKLRVGARADGTLTAFEGEFIASIGWKRLSSPPPARC